MGVGGMIKTGGVCQISFDSQIHEAPPPETQDQEVIFVVDFLTVLFLSDGSDWLSAAALSLQAHGEI